MVSAITSTTTATDTSKSAAADAKLSNNYNMFLKLLTTQLQYQDPTKPMDSSEFTNQLVQYSSVEQAIQQNSNLEQLISLVKGQSSFSAVNLIGTDVKANGNQAALANGQAKWAYNLDKEGDADLVVYDSGGKAVASQRVHLAAGDHTFEWDGKGNNVSKLPDGIYKLSVSGTDALGGALTTKVYSTGTVTSVDAADGVNVLSLNGVPIQLSDIVSYGVAN